MAPLGISPTKNMIVTLEDIVTSPSHVQGAASFSWTHANDQACFSLMDADRTCSLEELEKTDFWTLASQRRTVDPIKGNLILLLDDFYYGKHTRDGQPEQKTHTAFKCLSFLGVLKSVKFITHLRNHLELKKQRGDSWEIRTTCQHCFPPWSSCSVTLKASMLPGSLPQSVKSVNCPLKQFRFSYSTWRRVINLVKCPTCAMSAIMDHQPLLM